MGRLHVSLTSSLSTKGSPKKIFLNRVAEQKSLRSPVPDEQKYLKLPHIQRFFSFINVLSQVREISRLGVCAI